MIAPLPSDPTPPHDPMSGPEPRRSVAWLQRRGCGHQGPGPSRLGQTESGWGVQKYSAQLTEPDTVAMPKKTAQLQGAQGKEKKPNILTRRMQKKDPYNIYWTGSWAVLCMFVLRMYWGYVGGM